MSAAPQMGGFTFGSRLRFAIDEAHLSITGLAEETGMKRERMSDYVNDNTSPKATALAAIVTELSNRLPWVTSDWLLFGESAPRPRSSVDRAPIGRPPDLQLVKTAPPSPAASGALPSVRPAKDLGPKTVAAQPIAVARVTPKVTSSARRARDTSPSGRRQR
jgi:transcriptional regulator with XRE-family HTH domain